MQRRLDDWMDFVRVSAKRVDRGPRRRSTPVAGLDFETSDLTSTGCQVAGEKALGCGFACKEW